MDSDEWDEFFDDLGPGYDEVIERGTKVREKRQGRLLAQLYEYQGEQYYLLWDVNTGHNLSYTNYKNILKERENTSREDN